MNIFTAAQALIEEEYSKSQTLSPGMLVLLTCLVKPTPRGRHFDMLVGQLQSMPEVERIAFIQGQNIPSNVVAKVDGPQVSVAPLELPEADTEAMSVEDYRDYRKSLVTRRRNEAIRAGVEIAGIRIQTDDTSQNRITGAALQAVVDDQVLFNWKTADGQFVTLDAAQIIGAAQVVRAHVQACFDRESALLDALAAAEGHEAVAAVDIDTVWET